MNLTNPRRILRHARKVEFTWRYLFNLRPSLLYLGGHHRLSAEAARVLSDLNQNGIASTTANSLLPAGESFDELKNDVDRLETDKAEELASLKREADESAAIGEKTFISELLGEEPILDPSTVYARFALQSPILQIANAYFAMYTRLRYYNVWHTFSSTNTPRESQLWHRDREDFLILKMFVYMSDVDEGAGPLTYARGTHPKGRFFNQSVETFTEGGVLRSTDEQMAKCIRPENWFKGIGKRGTIVFADTRGYHKGGLARTKDRILYTCMFTSSASESREWFKRTAPINIPADREKAFALAWPKGTTSV